MTREDLVVQALVIPWQTVRGWRRVVSFCAGVMLSIGPGPTVPAQPASTRSPIRLDASAFTLLDWGEELPDGRLIALDVAEFRVLLFDFTSRTVVDLVTNGSGPGEMRYPRRVFRLSGGGVAVEDGATLRWQGFRADGSIAGPIPSAASEPFTLAAGTTGFPVRGDRVVFETFDDSGRQMLAESSLGTAGRESRMRAWLDSMPRNNGPAANGLMPAAGPNVRRPGFQRVSALWTASVDGWIAVASASPFRMRFVDPDGRAAVGPIISVPPIAPTARTSA